MDLTTSAGRRQRRFRPAAPALRVGGALGSYASFNDRTLVGFGQREEDAGVGQQVDLAAEGAGRGRGSLAGGEVLH